MAHLCHKKQFSPVGIPQAPRSSSSAYKPKHLAWWRKLTTAWRKKYSFLAQSRPIVAIAQKNDFSSYNLQFDYNTNLCIAKV